MGPLNLWVIKIWGISSAGLNKYNSIEVNGIMLFKI